MIKALDISYFRWRFDEIFKADDGDLRVCLPTCLTFLLVKYYLRRIFLLVDVFRQFFWTFFYCLSAIFRLLENYNLLFDKSSCFILESRQYAVFFVSVTQNWHSVADCSDLTVDLLMFFWGINYKMSLESIFRKFFEKIACFFDFRNSSLLSSSEIGTKVTFLFKSRRYQENNFR